MSYSFEIQGADKAHALNLVAAELDKVARDQPMHQADREQAHAAAQSLVELLGDAEGKDVSVTVAGWLATEAPVGEGRPVVKAVTLNVSTALVNKAKAAGESPANAG